MTIEFGILNFAALMLAAYVAKRDGHFDVCAVLGFGAYVALLWGVIDFAWRIYRDGFLSSALP
jgi:hypothetical protein